MADTGAKIELLGNLIKLQFRLMAEGDPADAAVNDRLKAYDARIRHFYGLLTFDFGNIGKREMLARAEAGQYRGTAVFREALDLLDAFDQAFPPESNPTRLERRDAVRKILAGQQPS